MVSLADLLALMLTFFVLMFSMNAVQLTEWQAVVSSFRKQFNPYEALIVERPDDFSEEARAFRPWGASLDYLSAVFSHKLSEGPWRGARLTQLEDRIILSLPAELVFESGSAETKSGAEEMVAMISEQLGHLANAVSVAGHTDPTPVRSELFRSNWELSLRRAEAVAALLQQTGYRRPVEALGYGAGRFADLSAALPQAERLSLGRRVDIAISAYFAGDPDAR